MNELKHAAEMAQKAPGKHFRKGISLIEIMRMFPDDMAAEKWFIETRWPDGIYCPECGSFDVHSRPKRKPQPFRCRSCRKDFSVKTGTLMHGSNLGLQTWAVAIYLLTTNLKGVSSMKLHRDLGITQKTAWHLAHRIRETWEDNAKPPFPGPVEADETYIGGKEKNKHAGKKLRAGRGPVGKLPVAGIKDRKTNQVTAKVVHGTDASTLQNFVTESTHDDATVYTDEAAAYKGIDREHESVNHSVGEYVRDMAHTNGMESFWATLKRGYHGVYHQMSEKHLSRYVNEFAGRHNRRTLNTPDQMAGIVQCMEGRRLRFNDLTKSAEAAI